MKKMISVLSAALLAVGMGTTALAAEINVTVDGTPVAWTDAKPFIDENDRTLVPLRPIANALGLEVAWNDDTNTASFTDGETTVEFVIGSNEYHCFLNDMDVHVYVEMDTEAVVANSRTYAPARYLAECFQYAVGWEQATQTVLITEKENAEEDAVQQLPEVPAGALATMSPVTIEAGSYATTLMAFNGVTFVEEPDIFEYSIEVLETDLESLGFNYSISPAEGYIEMELGTDFTTAPGTYPVTFTVPKGYFSDAKEDIVVSTTLTVTAPKAETALEAVWDDLQYGIFMDDASQMDEINALVEDEFSWIFEDTPFVLTVSEGTYNPDADDLFLFDWNEEYLIGAWDCTITVTNTETSASASKEVSFPLHLTPEFF